MTEKELDVLLRGAPGARLMLSGPDGRQLRVYFDRHSLASPAAWRATLRRAIGHLGGGWEPPRCSQDDHDVLVRVLFAFADATEHERVRAASRRWTA